MQLAYSLNRFNLLTDILGVLRIGFTPSISSGDSKSANLDDFLRILPDLEISIVVYSFRVCLWPKGQLISKCPFGIIVWTKIPFWISALNFFVASLGLPGDLVCNIITRKPAESPKKLPGSPPGRYKKFQGRNSEIILLVILSKR